MQKISNCSGTGAHIIQQNKLIKNGTINGTEIPLVTLGIGNGLYFYHVNFLTIVSIYWHSCRGGLHSHLTIHTICNVPVMGVNCRDVFNDSDASYGLQAAFAIGGTQEQVLDCQNPPPDANVTQLCSGKTLRKLLDHVDAFNYFVTNVLSDLSDRSTYDIRHSESDPAFVFDVSSSLNVSLMIRISALS